MIYTVTKTFEFEGRTYTPGQIIKLDEKQAKKLEGKVKTATVVFKPLKR